MSRYKSTCSEHAVQPKHPLSSLFCCVHKVQVKTDLREEADACQIRYEIHNKIGNIVVQLVLPLGGAVKIKILKA